MAEGRRFYWLKLKCTYFSQLEQKKMKRQPNGKDLQIIYLRMMLLSIDKGGYIYHQGVYDTLEEELAEEFDEPVEIVQETLSYLLENNLAELEGKNCFIPEALECTGSETDSARRMRASREKERASHCGTKCEDVQRCDTEKEIEKEIEKEKRVRINYQQIVDNFNDTCVSYPKITKLSDSRKKAIKARFNSGYTEADFKQLFEMAEESDFLKGKNNRNWQATFDWLIKDQNLIKVLDGNYRNRGQREAETDDEDGGIKLWD